MAIESLVNIEDISKTIENSHSSFELSDSQLSYLKELDVSSDKWASMSACQKDLVVTRISERFEELGISRNDLTGETISSIFSPEIVESYNNKFETYKFSSSSERTEEIGLSSVEKKQLIEETGWSSKIIDAIRTPAEAEVYKKAGLKEVNGNLERLDIDWNARIPQDRIDRMRSLYGDEVAAKWSNKTNMDLIKEGKAPYGPDGEWVNLHHIGQKPDSPLAELTNTEHKANDSILHNKTKSSEIERPVFRDERAAYWRNRYEELSRTM